MQASPRSGSQDPRIPSRTSPETVSSSCPRFPATKPQPHLPSACAHTFSHSPQESKHCTHPSGYVSKLCLQPRSSAPASAPTLSGAKGTLVTPSPFSLVGFPGEISREWASSVQDHEGSCLSGTFPLSSGSQQCPDPQHKKSLGPGGPYFTFF